MAGKVLTLVPNNTLTTDLSSDGRETTADAADKLTQDELERRAVEVPRPHHEPDTDGVDKDACDSDPFIAIRPLCERSGDDRGYAGGEDIRLTAHEKSE